MKAKFLLSSAFAAAALLALGLCCTDSWVGENNEGQGLPLQNERPQTSANPSRPNATSRPAHICVNCDHAANQARHEQAAEHGPIADQEIDLSSLDPFQDWLARHQRGETDATKGVALAMVREPAMKRLMKSDPKRAYELATPEAVWRALPAEIRPFVERRFEEAGTYEVSYDCFSDEVYRNLTMREFSSCDTSIAEELLGLARFEGEMRGVAFGNDAALVAMEDGGLVDEPPPVIENASSTGNLSMLWLSIKYSDETSYPDGVTNVTNSMNEVASNYAAWSYGRVSITFEYLEVSIPSAKGVSDSTVRSEANSAAIAQGRNPSNYDITLYRTTNLGNYSWIPSNIVHLKRNNTSTTVHEIGHAIGLGHANWWDPNNGQPAWGSGSNRIYREDWDAMSNAPRGDFNASEKKKLGWLDSGTDYVDDVSSGVYRIYPYDSHNGGFNYSGVNGAYYGVTVFKDTQAVNGENNDRRYFLSMRNQPEKTGNSYNGWYANGLLLHWEPWTRNGSEGYNANGPYGTTLIDAHVDSNAGGVLGSNEQDDAPIMVGETYVDNDPGNRDGDIYITVLSKTDPDGTPRNGDEYLDVKVVIGDQSGNQPPTVSISANKFAVLPGETITLTASATDPDDSALAYYWDFGIGIDQNARKAVTLDGAAVQNFSWATEGTYTVSVTVTDCRGGTHTATLEVFVGSPNLVFVESGGSTQVVENGTTDTYTVALNQGTSDNVTVNLTTDGQVTVSPAQLTFTSANWNVGQTVTVTAVNDAAHELIHSSTITHATSSDYTRWNGGTYDWGSPSGLLAFWGSDAPGIGLELWL